MSDKMKNGGDGRLTVKIFDRNDINISFGLYYESRKIKIVFEGFSSLF